MRAMVLVLALLLPGSAFAAPEDFVSRLKAMGPQDLRVSQNLGPPSGRARLAVEADGALRLTWGAGRAETFRFHPAEPPRKPHWDEQPQDPLDVICSSGGTAERLEIACSRPSDLLAAAIRPPVFTFEFTIGADGVRAVRTSVRSEERTVFSPAGLDPSRPPGVGPGAPAVVADALAQLAGHEKGGLGGGSSGAGDWFASDLWVKDVRGLDFVLERTVWPDRGGRSPLVPARWSFDYQGPAGGEGSRPPG
ncbi:hypothetical protein GVN21_05745 [Caulobacter sp. SLTY]|uniref:hypothetical protein n=1 Tax=Caulobacter sp. SLTY TaxID=2683262 RepID=UPI0014129893|nr:hypothetical protein [Caulobacter sp. SLTY]NBB14866.1 hypothetical protein [Caulobacter sp. SLTY]